MSHHATEDLSIMRSLPNIEVIAPGDDFETKEATKYVVDSSKLAISDWKTTHI